MSPTSFLNKPLHEAFPHPALPSRFLLISDRLATQSTLPKVVVAALDAGCRWILLREKDLPDGELLALAQEIMALARPYAAFVSISANLGVATACQAQGIHLPQGISPLRARQTLGKGVLLGVSTHSFYEAQRAQAEGADYVFLSPIFLSASKPGYGPALGMAELGRVSAMLSIPVLALGGVTPENAAACLQAGAFGVAVQGGVMRAPAPRQVVESLLRNLATG